MPIVSYRHNNDMISQRVTLQKNTHGTGSVQVLRGWGVKGGTTQPARNSMQPLDPSCNTSMRKLLMRRLKVSESTGLCLLDINTFVCKSFTSVRKSDESVSQCKVFRCFVSQILI